MPRTRKRKYTKTRRKKSTIKNYYNFSEETLEKLFKKKRYKKIVEWNEDKTEVRQTKEWLELKCYCYHRQDGKDPISGKALNKNANCHHLDYCEDNYGNFNSDNFVMLNITSHRCVHYILSCMHNSKDPKQVLMTLWELYKKTEKLNGGMKTWLQAH